MEIHETQKELESASRKFIFWTMFAVGCASMAGFGLAKISGTGKDIVTVVVANQEVAALSSLTPAQLRTVEWPSESLPQGTFSTIDDALRDHPLTLVALVPGQPVLSAYQSTHDRGLGVSQLVEPSMRAYVVEVGEALAKSQILRPGVLVDVIATVPSDPNNQSSMSSKIILQNVPVLAVGNRVDVLKTDKSSDREVKSIENNLDVLKVVTLLVSVTEIEDLTIAARQGKIDLALRNRDDAEVISTSGAPLDRLIGPSTGEARDAPAGAAGRESSVPIGRSRSTSRLMRTAGPSIYKVHK